MANTRSSLFKTSLTPLVAVLAIGAGAALGGPPGGGGSSGNPAIVLNNGGSIYMMNADGSNSTLVLASAGAGMLDPVLSPDASSIAFIGAPLGDGSLGLYTINTNGTGLTFLTPTGEPWGGCAWSPVPAPDGRSKIAFIDYPSGGGWTDVFMINTDGTGRAQMTFTPMAGELQLAWSPDATRFAVTHAAVETDCLIYNLGVDGTGQIVITGVTNITDVPGSPLRGRLLNDIQSPDWARGSSRIALAAKGPAGPDIWIIDLADPAHPVNITAGIDSKHDGYPSWSPDDSRLVIYRAGSGANTGLCTINANGTGLKVIRKSGNRPDWKRVP